MNVAVIKIKMKIELHDLEEPGKCELHWCHDSESNRHISVSVVANSDIDVSCPIQHNDKTFVELTLGICRFLRDCIALLPSDRVYIPENVSVVDTYGIFSMACTRVRKNSVILTIKLGPNVDALWGVTLYLDVAHETLQEQLIKLGQYIESEKFDG